MDKELARRIITEGTLIERVGEVDEEQPANVVILELDGELYTLTIERVG